MSLLITLKRLEGAIATLDANQRQVAAILLEPLQGEGGVNPGDLNYFQRVRQICDQQGILLILDEVQVGDGSNWPMVGVRTSGH